MTTRLSGIIKWLAVVIIAFGTGALTCYLMYPKVEIRPYIMLPETKIPPLKE